MSKIYGYVRVSSKDQNEERQLIAMRSFGIPHNQIYIDKKSGKDFNRPAYKKLIKKLKPNDTLVIKSIDRLGRDYVEILEQWKFISEHKKSAIVVLDMPLLDTRNDKDLVGKLISDIVLQLLSYVAETERTFIRQRQAEGIAVAKARGVRFGRPPLSRPASLSFYRDQWENGKISAREAARQLNITHSTFLRWIREC